MSSPISTKALSVVPRPNRTIPWIALISALLASGSYVLVGGGAVDGAAFFLVGSAVSLVAVLLFVVGAGRALVREQPAAETQRATGRRRKELEREKQGLLKAIKELEFDHAMHKLSDEDFREIAAVYRARAVRVMRQLDEAGADYRALIERDLASLQASSSGGEPGPRAAEAPPVAATHGLRPVCPCGTANDADASFCKRCGAVISTEIS